jgi:DNA-binding XRE family transcriptional regulator
MDQQTLALQFGQAVRRLRSNKGFSQEGFAHEVGVHRTTMGMIERGKAVVSIFTAYQVSEALGITLADLATETMSESRGRSKD